MLHGGAKQRIGMLALALEPNIMVNSTGLSWQRIFLPLKSYLIDVDDQACLMMLMLSHTSDGVAESCWRWSYVDAESY
jgi:ABC-type dipeptide/oligopeptide/nickel transport system ATPase subunit